MAGTALVVGLTPRPRCGLRPGRHSELMSSESLVHCGVRPVCGNGDVFAIAGGVVVVAVVVVAWAA